MLRKAIASALSGRRGPVVLTLPMDTTTATISVPAVSLEVKTSYAIAPAAIDAAVDAVQTSRRTVVLAGSGVRVGDGPARLREFAERVQCPVMTTPKGKGVFPESHPLHLGVFGMGGHASTSNFLQDGVDTMIAVGTSFGDLTTDGWSPLLKARRNFIQVDIDPQQIGRSYAVNLGIAAPAARFFEEMTARLPQAPATSFGIKYHCDPEAASVGTEGRIALPRALWEIQQVFARDTLFTVDVGEHFCFATHYLRINDPNGYILMLGLGSMGASISAAIGARVAHPQRNVVAICGDGCFAMNAFEIATAVAERLPIVVFVVNDRRLGMVEIGDTALYGRTPRYPTTPMNVAKIASALGAHGVTVQQPGEILNLDILRKPDRGPVVVELLIDRSIKLPKKGRFDLKPTHLATKLRLVN
jgi:acetolactate synthase-1/2/3 large subunit